MDILLSAAKATLGKFSDNTVNNLQLWSTSFIVDANH